MTLPLPPAQPEATFSRDEYHYRKLKAEYGQECAELHLDCWLCFRPINYSLDHPHPESFSLDHAETVKDHPELADDPLNFRPAHLVCNQQRGDDAPHIEIGEPSEDW